MDIKKANVLLLLGKIEELLGSLPGEVKKGGEFTQAEKALTQLQELFADYDGEIELLACRSKIRVIGG